MIWINSWFDPAKAQDSAKALLANGADILFSNAQDTPSVVTVGEESGAYVFNLNGSMKEYAPTKYLGVVKTDWAPFFVASVDAHIAGNFEGQNQWLGVNDAPNHWFCLLYTSPSPRDGLLSRMPSSA